MTSLAVGCVPRVDDHHAESRCVSGGGEIRLHQPAPALLFLLRHLGVAVARQIDQVHGLSSMRKKLMCVVLPGASPTRAKFFRSRSLLMTEDLPTLDLPAKAICGRPILRAVGDGGDGADKFRVVQIHGGSPHWRMPGLRAGVFDRGYRTEHAVSGRSRTALRPHAPSREVERRLNARGPHAGNGDETAAHCRTRLVDLLQILFIFRRDDDRVGCRAAAPAIVFSFSPPIGSTRPRMEISPVMATSRRTARAGQRRDDRRADRNARGGAVLGDRRPPGSGHGCPSSYRSPVRCPSSFARERI